MNKAVLEGLLFVVGEEGLTLSQIGEVLELEEEACKDLVMELKKDYEDESRGLRIDFLGDRFKLTTKFEHRSYYQKLIETPESNLLSQSALETLAIIAYNEPITRLEVDEIRGVNSSQIVRRLLAHGLIKACGKADTIGKPNLYRTTNDFLDYFGLSSKDDLPEIIYQQREENDNGDLYDTTYKETK